MKTTLTALTIAAATTFTSFSASAGSVKYIKDWIVNPECDTVATTVVQNGMVNTLTLVVRADRHLDVHVLMNQPSSQFNLRAVVDQFYAPINVNGNPVNVNFKQDVNNNIFMTVLGRNNTNTVTSELVNKSQVTFQPAGTDLKVKFSANGFKRAINELNSCYGN